MAPLKKIPRLVLDHRYGFTLFAFLTAAAVTGAACVLFMWAFEFVLNYRLDFGRIGLFCIITTPLLFLLSIELIRRFAPEAEGAGIPQVIFAAKHLTPATEERLFGLIAPKTFVVKVIALLIGIWAGASTGREGPTVHVATCVFLGVLWLFRNKMPPKYDMRSAVVAGGAAGLAAAFNTPLAGVTFAIEELSTDYFSSIKEYVLIAIIVAAIAAQSLTGEYAYFGKLMDPLPVPLYAVLLIGLAGGLFGAFFSTAILRGNKFLARFRQGSGRWILPVVFSLGLLFLAAGGGPYILGPGNQAAQILTDGGYGAWASYFPFAKMAATLLTYWSGIAGGIFAPCLSIGSALGADIAYIIDIPTASCALIGMAAFLSGTIQAPMTSFVIIFEMTGHHQMLLPVMLASLLSFMVAHLLGAEHLYQGLAQNYRYLL